MPPQSRQICTTCIPHYSCHRDKAKQDQMRKVCLDTYDVAGVYCPLNEIGTFYQINDFIKKQVKQVIYP